MLVILLAGLAFSWEQALYAMLALYIGGVAAEVVTEGASVVRTALIISDKPQEVAGAILREMERGVTGLRGECTNTQQERTVLFVVISRSNDA